MKKVIIHIGQYKTGSTSIQNMMWEARHELLEHGVLYPQSLTREGAHFGITDLLRKEYWNAGKYADLEPLREEIDRSSASNIVISCESLSGATLRNFSPEMMEYIWRRLEKLLSGLEIRVLFYVRRQDESINSRIIQEIKGCGRRTGIDYAPFLYQKSSLNYQYFYSLIEQVFGAGNADVRLYDRDYLAGRDVRLDFLEYLGIPASAVVLPPVEENVSPSSKLLAMYRIINSMNLGEQDYFTVNDGLWKAFGENGVKAVVLGREQREDVMAYFRESNLVFLRECVPLKDKRAFENVLMKECCDVESNVHVDVMEVLEFFKSKGFQMSRTKDGAINCVTVEQMTELVC